MGKSKLFTGQPVFSQILNLIPGHILAKCILKHGANRYYKKFDSRHHLVSMLFAVFSDCKSLREVVTGLQVAGPKLGHLRLKANICRSTFSDANHRRPEAFFSDLFHSLYCFHFGSPDSRRARRSKKIEDQLFIMDSTTISLFHDVLKGAGSTPANGKRKGGLKAHLLIKADEDTPCVVNLTAGSANDRTFFKHLPVLPKGSIITFDKGYANFRQFQSWADSGVTWVSRNLDRWIVNLRKEKPISEADKTQGLIADQLVTLGDPNNNKTLKIKARLITYKDPITGKNLIFATNSTKYLPLKIAHIYKCRWQIELLFKRLKQRYPLRYFLGESENAIKIQVWCALIADLLTKTIQKSVKKKWAYSNLSSLLKMHLLTYIDLKSFLNHPEKALKNYEPPEIKYQLSFFSD